MEKTITDGRSWVGRVITGVLLKEPEKTRGFLLYFQDTFGPHKTAELINALRDTDVDLSVAVQDKPKMTEERKAKLAENLTKARAAKKAKKKGE